MGTAWEPVGDACPLGFLGISLGQAKSCMYQCLLTTCAYKSVVSRNLIESGILKLKKTLCRYIFSNKTKYWNGQQPGGDA